MYGQGHIIHIRVKSLKFDNTKSGAGLETAVEFFFVFIMNLQAYTHIHAVTETVENFIALEI